MHQTDPIHIFQCHACGEVGDVIVKGVAPPPGETLWEQSRWIAREGTLRNFVLNEPRGGVHKHVNLLVPPKHPEADADYCAWINEHIFLKKINFLLNLFIIYLSLKSEF